MLVATTVKDSLAYPWEQHSNLHLIEALLDFKSKNVLWFYEYCSSNFTVQERKKQEN